LFKSLFPALASCAIYVALAYTTYAPTPAASSPAAAVLGQTYPIAALIATLTFILTFRVNNAYARWWEAYTSVTAMQSKLLDVGSSLASYALAAQPSPPADRYRSRDVPSFAATAPPADSDDAAAEPCVERVRTKEMSMEELEKEPERREKLRRKRQKPSAVRNFIGFLGIDRANDLPDEVGGTNEEEYGASPSARRYPSPPFLEEAAHLLSLLSAVAFSTLRNDVDGTDPPLIAFDPREPFPHVDPDDYQVRRHNLARSNDHSLSQAA
jgi:hypothetical protein